MKLASTHTRAQRLNEKGWRRFILQIWAFYFAHRPLIVLGMLGYLVLIHVAAANLFWHSRWPGIIAWKLGIGSQWVEFDRQYKIRSDQLRRMANAVDPGATLFIGDSLLSQLDVGALTDRAVQLSIKADTIRRVHSRLYDYRTLHQARLIFFHVGTNDLLYRAPEQMRRVASRMLRRVPASVPIIMSGILPVDEQVFEPYGNADVAVVNAVLEQVCRARPGCRFIMTGGRLTDARGNLDPRYHTGDGLHLNEAGNRLWRAELMPILDPWRSF